MSEKQENLKHFELLVEEVCREIGCIPSINISPASKSNENMPNVKVLGEYYYHELLGMEGVTIYYGSFKEVGFMSTPDSILKEKIKEVIEHEIRHSHGDEDLSREDHNKRTQLEKKYGVYWLSTISTVGVFLSIVILAVSFVILLEVGVKLFLWILGIGLTLLFLSVWGVNRKPKKKG